MRVFEVNGACGDTYTATSTDTAAALAAVKLLDANSRVCKAINFTVETQTIRWAIGTATQAGVGHSAAAGTSWRVTGEGNVKAFTFISAAAGVHGTLHITPEY